MSPPHRPPRRDIRAAVAIAIGTVSGLLSHAALMRRHVLAGDFTWPWRAARILLQHHDPYVVIQATGAYPFNDRLNYPLPAALVSMPFAPLRPELAGALFVGLSAALLAWAATREDFHWLPLFVSAPFLKVLLAPQWSPLLTAAALTPALQFACVVKPNLGLAAFTYNPTRRGALLGAILLAVSVAIVPAWPREWLHNLSRAPQYGSPAVFVLGPLLLLAVLRWRTREGRLLLVMALVPQALLVYDQLPLWLIPRRWWSSLLLSIASWPALVAWAWPPAFGFPRAAAWNLTEYMTLFCIYMPALLMVLQQPVGDRAVWRPRLRRRDTVSVPAASSEESPRATAACRT